MAEEDKNKIDYTKDTAPEPPEKEKNKQQEQSTSEINYKTDPAPLPPGAAAPTNEKEPLGPPPERRSRAPKSNQVENNNSDTPQPPAEQKEAPGVKATTSKKSAKETLIQGLENTASAIDNQLPKLLKDETKEVQASVTKKAQSANQELKKTMKQVIDIVQQLPDDSSPQLNHSGKYLNRLAKMTQGDYTELNMQSQGGQNSSTPFQSEKAQKALIERLESKITENAESLIVAIKTDATEAKVNYQVEQEKQSTKDLPNNARPAKISKLITSTLQSETINNDPELKAELEGVQQKINKGEKKGEYDFGLSKEKYLKIYESTLKIQQGIITGDQAKEEIKSINKTITESLSTERKVSSAVSKSITIGAQKTTKPLKKGAKRLESAAKSDIKIGSRKRKTTSSEKENKAKVGAVKKDVDPLSQLQALNKQTVVGDLIDTLHKIDTSSQKNKQQQEKLSESKAKKETVDNRPPQSQIRATIDKARAIVSGVRDKIKPAVKDSPPPPTTSIKTNKSKGRG